MVAAREVVVVNTEDARELAALEAIFETCQIAWLKASQALAVIKEKQLFKAAGYKKWDDYLRERWGLGQWEGDHKILMGKVASEISLNQSDPRLKESHMAELAGFPPDLRDEIFQTAQQTAPGGKLTASWIEQTGRRLQEARLAEVRAAQEAPPPEEDDEEEDDADDPKPPPKPAAPPPKNDQAIRDAARHDIARSEWIQKREKQLEKTQRKEERFEDDLHTKQHREKQAEWHVRRLEQIALDLNTTAQELLDRFASG